MSRASAAALVAVLLCAGARKAVAQPEQPPQPPAQDAISPPQALHTVLAVYPPEALAKRREATVVVMVTVAVDGRVSEATVTESAGKAFDDAAIAAVLQWRFASARRAGAAIASRIRVPFRFVAPIVEPARAEAPATAAGSPANPAGAPVATDAANPGASPVATDAASPGASPAATAAANPGASPAATDAANPGASPAATAAANPGASPAATAAANQPGAPAAPEPDPPQGGAGRPWVIDVDVRGRRRPPAPRALSDFHLPHDVITAAPHRDAGAMLAAAPGVYVTRPEGEAVAHVIFLRGFEAEHGQDIEIGVGPLPINQPSHVHGQGYADLNFIIPEVVRAIRVTEGVYDPRQGDFAVAGSIDFDLGVRERGFQLKSSYGSFNSWRQLVLWAPEGHADDTFAAASFHRSDGYGQNRGSLSGGAIGQYAFDGPRGFRGLVHLSAHAARAKLAGVLRQDDLDAGRVDFYDSYPDPSAAAQSALALRAQSFVALKQAQSSGEHTEFAVWLLLTSFRFRSNFTGYLERSSVEPAWVGRGDLLEEDHRELGLGGRAHQRTRRLAPFDWLSGTFEVGLSSRVDFIEQGIHLVEEPGSQTWDRRADAGVRAATIGAYGDLDWRITRYLRLRGGLRADVLVYDVDDRLGTATAETSEAPHLPGLRRTAAGIAIGPRASLAIHPLPWLALVGSYGEGFRSPQARQLDLGGSVPLARVRSLEGGASVHPFGEEKLQLGLAGYATFLSSDLAFDPGEGSVEPIGRTSRKGLVLRATTRPFAWALGSASVTYVHATLDEPPSATEDNPTPPNAAREPLPYVPPLVVRADLAVQGELGNIHKAPLTGRIGAGFSFLAARPLPYGQFADPFALLDAAASLRWRFVELGFEGFNLSNNKYAQNEFSLVSDFGTRPVPSRVPARHLAAGPPLTAMATVALRF
jgi:TonB family protein